MFFTNTAGHVAKARLNKNSDLDPRIMEVAKKLEKLRIERGYTSYENFAIEHGISRMQYWRMEKGTNFTFSSFLKILDAHKMNLAEFFSDADK